MTTDALFEGYGEGLPTFKDLTDGQRRRLRNDRLIAQGIHPLAFTVLNGVLRLLAPPGEHTCGECVHRRQVNQGCAKDFPKCMHPDGRATRSIASDCRASWPACVDFEAKP